MHDDPHAPRRPALLLDACGGGKDGDLGALVLAPAATVYAGFPVAAGHTVLRTAP